MKDTKINELFNIPIRTIQDMKNTKDDNWRFKVYTFLKSQNEQTIKEFFRSHQESNNIKK